MGSDSHRPRPYPETHCPSLAVSLQCAACTHHVTQRFDDDKCAIKLCEAKSVRIQCEYKIFSFMRVNSFPVRSIFPLVHFLRVYKDVLMSLIKSRYQRSFIYRRFYRVKQHQKANTLLHLIDFYLYTISLSVYDGLLSFSDAYKSFFLIELEIFRTSSYQLNGF